METSEIQTIAVLVAGVLMVLSAMGKRRLVLRKPRRPKTPHDRSA
jgi:hypothetical protein